MLDFLALKSGYDVEYCILAMLNEVAYQKKWWS